MCPSRLPPGERLEADDRPVGQRDERLVVRGDLAAVDRVAQRPLELHPPGDPLAHRRSRTSSPCCGRSPSSDTSPCRLPGSTSPLPRVGAGEMVDADRRRDEHLTRRRGRSRRPRSAGSGRPADVVAASLEADGDDDELVARDAPDDVVGRARSRRSASAATTSSWSPIGVAHRVVHELELIEIDEHHRHRLAGRPRVGEQARRCARRSSTRFGSPVSSSCVRLVRQPDSSAAACSFIADARRTMAATASTRHSTVVTARADDMLVQGDDDDRREQRRRHRDQSTAAHRV